MATSRRKKPSAPRLKGIDISVGSTKKKPEPSDMPCEWEGCDRTGGCKAPKSPDRLREYHNFCAPHAREYNKNWNFFSGMSDDDITRWQQGARHGHRPTWDAKKNTSERTKVGRRKAAGGAAAGSYNIFGGGAIGDSAEAPRRQISKLQLKALHDMGLDETANSADVRRRYTQLVKQLHPDANRGDRSTEESFARVVKAYKVLKTLDLG